MSKFYLVSRSSYRRLYITIRTATRYINLACYCRYAADSESRIQAIAKAIAKAGYAGVIGKVYYSRRLANSVQSFTIGPCRVESIAA